MGTAETLGENKAMKITHYLHTAVIVADLQSADILLTSKSHVKRVSQKVHDACSRVEIRTLRANTAAQMKNFLREEFHDSESANDRQAAMQEVEEGVIEAFETHRVIQLSPQPKHLRRLQHIYIERSGLRSESKGKEPLRRIVIYPHR